ncbi:MAG: Transketolase, C-terminal section [Anaerolineae bacterium]|mgnify:CR=1 FL=1|jgi:transketolase|nr:MAG: Transketolase, C-terminal section [Anaerolineae bacterium]
MRIESKVHARKLVEWAKDKPYVVVFSADLTSSTEIELFRDAYPERFFSFGMTEQNMMSVAGGMAREGYTPFVHTFAVFLYRRALDQITISVAYPNLPVRIFGFLPGITTPGGATHQAIDDIAILRAIPNMTVLETGDATEVESIFEAIHEIPGPVYVRQLRGEIPRLFPPSEPLKIGKARVLSTGNDIALFSSGICTEEAMRATQVLQTRGISISHLHISTHKPFNQKEIVEVASQVKYGVITMENHTIIGGLGSEVAEALAESGLNKRLIRIGLKDTFAHGGSRPYLMRYYEIDAMSLIRHIESLIGNSLGVDEEELKEVRIEPIHSESKAEAL